jgi:hypothetical protein
MKKEIIIKKELERLLDDLYLPLGKTRKAIQSFVLELRQSTIQDCIDKFMFEVFIAKDGILPLKEIWLKPNEIGEIRKKLTNLIK